MSGQHSIKETFLIDIGNSRIKVAALTSPQNVVLNTADTNELCTWLSAQAARKVFCASVRGEQYEKDLSDIFERLDIQLTYIRTERAFGELKNSYSNVSNMGVDRWLSMVACINHANEKQLPAFAVLMFGTAITCDVVSEGQHQGGWIIPGRALMKDALEKNTARVFSNVSDAHKIRLGQSTPDCVDFGCFAAASGVILTVENLLSSQYERYCIFLTGGDDKVLTAQKGDAIFRVENLVLRGLAIYANNELKHEISTD